MAFLVMVALRWGKLYVLNFSLSCRCSFGGVGGGRLQMLKVAVLSYLNGISRSGLLENKENFAPSRAEVFISNKTSDKIAY